MTRPVSLVRVVLWAHQYLGEVLSPGDSAVDLTAGNGADTLFLARQVGPSGRVAAFDIQQPALTNTAALLDGAAIPWRLASAGSVPLDCGVTLIHDSHCRLDRYLKGPVRAIVANLGYLPGGDPGLTTQADSTVVALTQALELLCRGGRLAVVLYVSHPGAIEESQQIEALFQGLSSRLWHVIRIQVVNRHAAPYLLVVEKR